MTASSPQLGEPRWHTDPEGGAGLRWWDGSQWTESVMGPAELGPPVQHPLSSDTPIYTVPLWVIVFLPLVTMLGNLLIPAPSLAPLSGGQTPQMPAFDPSDLMRNGLSLAIYAATIVLAFADRRALLQAGYVRPFHWAWAFLSTGVYVVGRSIIVQRRIGRGLQPLLPVWIWVAVALLSTIVAFSALARSFSSLMTLSALG
jgi:hypothetical protein